MATPPLCIVLDANVLIAERLLRSPLGVSLLYSAQRMGARLGLPDIVESEVRKHVLRLGLGHVAKIDDAYTAVAMIVGERDDYQVPDADELKRAIEARLSALDDLIVRLPMEMRHVRGALERVNDGTPPNGEKNQQFKDSVIWEIVLEFASESEVHFVTEDKGFFANRKPQQGLANELAGDVEASPHDIRVFHELSALVEHLQHNVPKLDLEAAANALAKEVRPLLDASFAEEELLDVGDYLEHELMKPFVTEDHERIALSFRLAFEGVNLDLDAAEETATVRATGSCFFDLGTEQISSVQLDEIAFEQEDGGRTIKRFFLGSFGSGGRRVPYKLRHPL